MSLGALGNSPGNVLPQRVANAVVFLVLLLTFLAAPHASAGTEYVLVQKVMGDKGLIQRANGEVWLIEKGVGAISFISCEGKQVLIQSPGLFCGIGSKIILPDHGQEAKIWEAKLVETGAPAAAAPAGPSPSDTVIRALILLGLHDPASQDEAKGSPAQALKAFQKKRSLPADGKISFQTLLALSDAVLNIKPVSDTTLAASGDLLACADTMLNAPPPAPGGASPAAPPGQAAAAAAAAFESRIADDFEGWEGETVVTLVNGQQWQQVEFYYHYHYAFMPKVTILKSGTVYKMLVEGVPKAVGVMRIR